MLKSDLWIKKALKDGIIKGGLEQLQTKGLSCGVSSYGYDVRLDAEAGLKVYGGGYMDPKGSGVMWIDVAAHGTYYELPPQSFALGCTTEAFELPDNITGLVYPKSTYARCGLICYQTILEAGWAGQITLEFYNPLHYPIRLYCGEGIAQVLFLEGDTGLCSYSDRKGKYQDQKGVTLAKVL